MKLLAIGFFLLISKVAVFAQTTWDLDQTLRYAVAHSPILTQGKINVQNSQEQLKGQKGLLLPSVDAGVSHSYSLGSTINPSSNQRESLNVQYDQAYAQASVDVFNWKKYLQLSGARVNLQSANAQFNVSQNQMKLDVIQAFFQYIQNRAWVLILKEQVSGMQEQVDRTQKEVENGNRAKSDIYDIKANLSSILQESLNAENQQKIAKINLLAALNIHQDTVNFEVKDTSFQVIDAPTNPQQWVEDLVAKNPIYAQMQQQLKWSKNQIKVAKADYLPTLSGSYQWSSFFSKNLINQDFERFQNQIQQNQNQNIGLTLNIPIFNQRVVKTKVRMAKLAYQHAEAEQQKQLNALYQTMFTIVQQYQNAWQRNQLLVENFQFQKLSFERSQDKYKEGLMDAYLLFTVRNNWLQANYSLLQSKYDLMQQSALMHVFMN